MAKDTEPRNLPAPTLDSLALSLSAAALAYLGHQLGPEMKKEEVNLPLAQHTIATIELLRTKTEGNRTPEETRLFDELLYQLRMTYVAAEQELKNPSSPRPEPGQST